MMGICAFYFTVAMQRERDELVDGPYRRDFLTYDNHLLDGDIFLQALNGFLMILDCNGELFFATHTIETYLGFHQVRPLFIEHKKNKMYQRKRNLQYLCIEKVVYFW